MVSTLLPVDKYLHFLSNISLPELSLDKGRQWDKVEDHVGEEDDAREGKVDGGVGPRIKHCVKVNSWVVVLLGKQVGPVHKAAAKVKIIL